jgi:hypothetical protein
MSFRVLICPSGSYHSSLIIRKMKLLRPVEHYRHVIVKWTQRLHIPPA